MTKIITVTANTAIDFFIEAEGMAEKNNIQAKASVDFACGKGVNVAKAVEALGYPVLCLGFVGQQSESQFNALNSRLLHVDLIAVEGKTRTNITLYDSKENSETHIRTAGFCVSSDDCRNLIRKIDHYAASGDIAVLSGSLPPGAPVDLYRTIIEQCHKKSVITLLDTSGKSLAAGIMARPYAVKPNLQELEELVDKPLPDDKSIAIAARSLIEQGVGRVYVSLGSKGALAEGESRTLKGYIKDNFDKIITHIGCGDAMVAGLAIAILQNRSLGDSIKQGIACGTANLFTAEPGRLEKNKVTDLFNQTEIDTV